MKTSILQIFVLTILLLLLSAQEPFSSVTLNFDEAVIPDQSLGSVPIGDFKNERVYNSFKMATSDNYILLLVNTPWAGVWSSVRLTHGGELIDTIPRQIRTPDYKNELAYLGLTWSEPYFYIWEGMNNLLYYTRFTDDLILIDESPQLLGANPNYLAVGGHEAWTIDQSRRVWGYDASSDSLIVDEAQISGWRPITGVFIKGLVDNGVYLARRNPVDSVTDLAHVSQSGHVQVLAPALYDFPLFQGSHFSDDSAIFWSISRYEVFQYYFASPLDSLASETLHEIDLSVYFDYSTGESFSIYGKTGILTGRSGGGDNRKYIMNFDLEADTVVSFSLLDSLNYSIASNFAVSQIKDTSLIFYSINDGIEMAKIFSNDLSVLKDSHPVLYGQGHHSQPSMLKDSLGILMYLITGSETGIEITGYRWNDPIIDNLSTPTVYDPNIGDSAICTPHLFDVGDQKGLYWEERLPDDSSGEQSGLYKQKVTIFQSDTPTLDDINNAYYLDTIVLKDFRKPATIKIRDTLYIMSKFDGPKWYLRSIDLIEKQKTALELYGFSHTTPILINHYDSLYRIGLYEDCLEWSPPNNYGCILWKYFIYSRGYVADTATTYFDGFLPMDGVYIWKSYTPNITDGIIVDNDYYIAVSDPPAIQNINFVDQTSTPQTDISQLLSTPLDYLDSYPMITLTPYRGYRIVLYFRHDINVQEAFVFDQNWQLVAQQDIPIIGAIQELGGVEFSADSSKMILAYTAFLPYPYTTERLVVQSFSIDLSTDLSEETAVTPYKFELSQNYPNPFNPITTISYSMPEKSHVSISIYNILGRKIITLLDEVRAAGEHKIEWNGRDADDHQVASGIYLYKIQSGDFVSTRKMILLK